MNIVLYSVVVYELF